MEQIFAVVSAFSPIKKYKFKEKRAHIEVLHTSEGCRNEYN